MNTREGIRLTIDMADMVCKPYLEDLSDEELMLRPHAGCNHIKWQLGHLISSEHNIMSGVLADAMPPLPEGFADRYSKETASSDDPAAFDSKEDLMRLWGEQRAATLAALENMSDEDLDKPAPEEMQSYAPNVGAAFALQGSHWLMHCGQWVIVRRETGRTPLF